MNSVTIPDQAVLILVLRNWQSLAGEPSSLVAILDLDTSRVL